MTERAVVIAGAGPTGLMLAGELALAGVDVMIVERRPNQDLVRPGALGMFSRTIELLDQRGIAERFIAEGTKHQAPMFPGTTWVGDLATRHNYVLGLAQKHTERVLAGWVRELNVAINYGLEITGFTQDDAGVDVRLSDERALRAQYLVGCDGGQSRIRRTAGIEFPGWEATTSWLNADVRTEQEPKWGFHEDALGKHAIGKGDGGSVRLVLREPSVENAEPTLRDVSAALTRIYGTDYGVHSPIWISRFTDMARQAATYRERRVLLAGDSAHVHSPVGGQGMGTGVQDAVNLGWKLAQVVNGTSPASLLDTYHAERHPVAARVIRNNLAESVLARNDARTKMLRDVMNEVLALHEPSRRIGAMMFGLDIHYDLGGGHPLLGRRMPDLDLVTAGGPLRLFTLLHKARPVLLNLGAPGSIAITSWRDRVQSVDATYSGALELPVIGAVETPRAVLIRPDGHVAWVGDHAQAGLEDALMKWFGPAAAKS